MVLYKTWVTELATDPSLVTRVVEEGMCCMGYESIKSEQLSAVQSLLNGDDGLMSVPTGFGKSLVSSTYAGMRSEQKEASWLEEKLQLLSMETVEVASKVGYYAAD